MLTILLMSAALAGGEPLDSLSEWVGSWNAARQSLTLTVEESGHYRMDIDQKGERCFLEGTLLVRDGMVRFGSPEERQAHLDAAEQEHQAIEDLEAEAKVAENGIQQEVQAKPKLEKRYSKEGYTFVHEYGGRFDVDLPEDHPKVVAVKEALEVVRHCHKDDETHPHHWPLLGSTPQLFFAADDRVVALFQDHNGKDRYYRFAKAGAEVALEAEGDMGGAWVVRSGPLHADAQMWGQALVTDAQLELTWDDGCVERAKVRKNSAGFAFEEHEGTCDRLGTFRRVITERGGILRLRDNTTGVEMTLLREDGL